MMKYYPIPYTLYPKPSRKGFTLIEILLVMGITIIMATMGSIALNSFLKFRELESAMREVVLRVRDAQQRAITQEEGSAWGIRFINSAAGQDSYILFKGTPSVPITTTIMNARLEWEEPTINNTIDITFSKILGGITVNTPVTLKIKGSDCMVSPESCKTITIKQNGVVEF